MKFSATRSELDGMVVEIELTLVSIIQGVALTVLIENAHSVIAVRQLFFWLYVVAGLFIIFIFWSRAVLHILTVIRWPLEFGHNFLYIACALVEAILFAQIGKPASWFGFGAVFIAIGWTLFVYDLRLIYARMRDSAGEASPARSVAQHWSPFAGVIFSEPGLGDFNSGLAGNFSGAQRARLADRSRAAWVRRIFGLRRSLLC